MGLPAGGFESISVADDDQAGAADAWSSFELAIDRTRDAAATSRQPKAFLALLGHNFDLQYGGTLSGQLSAQSPYVVVQELEITASLSVETKKELGVVDALGALPPYGPAAAAAMNAIPTVRDWLNDRANIYAKITPGLSGTFILKFQHSLSVKTHS